MLQRITLILALLLSCPTSADTPEFFTEEIDFEYRALLKHVRKVLPESDLPLVYLPLLGPFNLLDVRPVKFKIDENKQSFSNFNFGVFGGMLLNIDRKLIPKLLSMSICKKSKCKAERIEVIKAFLSEASGELIQLNKNKKLFIIQQTDAFVYRVNNTFYTPTTLITYFPSQHAGFVPSAQYKEIAKIEDAPELWSLSNSSNKLRALMGKYKVSAIAKIDDVSTNIIFGGLADNHWGVVIEHYAKRPEVGGYNHIGLEYDIIHDISKTSFYYQTN